MQAFKRGSVLFCLGAGEVRCPTAHWALEAESCFSFLFGNCHKPLEIQALVEAKSSGQDPDKQLQAMDGHKWLVRAEDLRVNPWARGMKYSVQPWSAFRTHTGVLDISWTFGLNFWIELFCSFPTTRVSKARSSESAQRFRQLVDLNFIAAMTPSAGRPQITGRYQRPSEESVQQVTSVTLWLCQNSYWKWPFIVDFPIKHGDFP